MAEKDDPDLVLEKSDYEALLQFAKQVRVPALDRSIVRPVCADDLEVKDENVVEGGANSHGGGDRCHNSGDTGDAAQRQRQRKDADDADDDDGDDEVVEEDIAPSDSPQQKRLGKQGRTAGIRGHRVAHKQSAAATTAHSDGRGAGLLSPPQPAHSTEHGSGIQSEVEEEIEEDVQDDNDNDDDHDAVEEDF